MLTPQAAPKVTSLDLDQLEPLDVVGVGFGPSNLSLAVAFNEMEWPGSVTFFERQSSFGWHRGMLLPSTKMQVSFLKDLVTFRNPASRFSFVAYLHAVGRLAKFNNNKDFFPTRAEFHEYLEWVGSSFADCVAYGCEVTQLRPLESAASSGAGVLVTTRSTSPGRRTQTVAARNVVISCGLSARMPSGVERGDRIWHSSDFLLNYKTWRNAPLRSVAVVGAGQSAAEIARFLHDELTDGIVHVVIPSYGYVAADSTPLANEVFDPGAVDDYYNAGRWSKETLWNYHRNTNYSVVDEEIIKDLYQRMYREDVAGDKRLHLLRMTRLQDAQPVADGVQLTVHSDLHNVRKLDVDVVVCATGYAPMNPEDLLGELNRYCRRDDFGRLLVGRDYRLATDPALRCGIYLQGGTEYSHGLSSSLLSNIAVRSGEIATSIMASQVPPALSVGVRSGIVAS